MKLSRPTGQSSRLTAECRTASLTAGWSATRKVSRTGLWEVRRWQIVGDPEVIQMGIRAISTGKSASHQEIKH
jgi:hypothetical protein